MGCRGAAAWVMLALLVAACGQTAEVTTTAASSTTTAAATTTTAPATTTRTCTTTPTTTTTVPVSWVRVAAEDGVVGGPGWQGMYAVVAGGPGFVAVGDDDNGTGAVDVDAAMWVSENGRSWSRVADDPGALGGPGIQYALDVTVGGPGLVAVGNDIPPGGDWDSSNAAVWTSVDGFSWTRVRAAVLGGSGIQTMSRVIADGPGLVAIDNGASGFWTSADALVWEWHEASANRYVSFQPWAVTPGGPGLVAVGITYAHDIGNWWSVATSPDAVTWTQTLNRSAFDNGFVWAVVAGGPGLVAVGQSMPGTDDAAWNESDAAVWTSVDGYAWTRVPDDEGVFGGPGLQQMFDIAVGGPGLVAVGADTSPTGLAVAAAWASVDGLTWTRMPVPAGEGTSTVPHERQGEEMLSVTVGGPGLVAVGRSSLFGDLGWEPAVWYWAIDQP